MFMIISSIAGFAFAAFLVGFMYKRDAIHWNYLAKTYARPWQKPISERWGNAVLYGKFPVSKAYNGILKIGVHEDGFSLRVRFPLISYFCEPLFIPFRDVRGWDQTWYLNSKTVELELAGAPEVKIAMPQDQLEWLKSAGGTEIAMMNQPSPHKDKPTAWHTYLVVSSILMVFGSLYVLINANLN